MKWIRALLLFGLIWIVQIWFLPLFAIGEIVPDPGLILLLIWAINRKSHHAYLIAFAFGFALDLVASPLTGAHAFAYLPALFYMYHFVTRDLKHHFIEWSFHILVPLLLFALLYYQLTLYGEDFSFLAITWRQVLPATLYNWAIIIVIRGIQR
ncbi:MAG: rod shape-determining protein MreD [Candidatus Delongbacteria bacterium]|nr:rod shape-determining protein MreD [bacterium]MBL7032969.1 rod shape-determining protein MreD [Candidatus Delongbacteria bacterium]